MKANRVKLGTICTVVSGSTPKSSTPEYWDGEVKWITPAEISDETYVINDSVRHITVEGAKSAGLKSFPEGTVILSSRAPIGKTAIAGCEMYCNQGFKNLICSDVIDNRYLYFFLSGKSDYLNSLGRGATFKELSKGIVEGIEIPLPSLSEQWRIADVFEALQGLSLLYKEQLALLDDLVKSRFVEMFGEYNVAPAGLLQDVSEFVTVGIANAATHAYAETGVVMLRNLNVRENHLDDSDLVYIKPEFAAKYDKKALKTNDILVTRTGYPGIACVVPEKYEGCQTFTTLIVRLRENAPVTATYVSQFINSPLGKEFVERMKAGSSQQNFGATSLKQMPIGIPPLNRQQEFVAFVQQVDKSKVAVQRALERLELLKASLMQEYFG